jgi:hypothetical protein
LISGNTKSCGKCGHKSIGEDNIRSYLTNKNISFLEQKSFEINPYTKTGRFDFFINNEYIVEFDGEQHYSTDYENLFVNKDN